MSSLLLVVFVGQLIIYGVSKVGTAAINNVVRYSPLAPVPEKSFAHLELAVGALQSSTDIYGSSVTGSETARKGVCEATAGDEQYQLTR